jgi:O-antigen ligase
VPPSALAYLLAFFGSLVGGFVRWPLLVLGAYLLAFFGHPPSRWWGYALPDLRWAFTSALFVMIVAIRYTSRNTEKKVWCSDPIIVLVISFVAWMWIQTPWAVDQNTHLEGTVMMSKYLIIIFAMIKLLDTSRSLELFNIMVAAGCAYFGVLAREMATSSSRLDGVGGPGVDDSSTLGTMFAVGAMLAIVQLTRGPIWSRIFCLCTLPFTLNGLILTQSRGAFLGLAAGGAVLALLAPKGDRVKIRLLAAVGVVALLFLAQNTFWQRIDTIDAKDGQRDFSAETRIVLAQAQLKMFKDHPFGAGHRGTAALSRQYLDLSYMARDRSVPIEKRERSSHNTTLSVLVEQGIPGIIIWVALLGTTGVRVVRVLQKANKSEDEEQRRIALQISGIAAAMIVVFVSGNFADFLRAEVQFWLWAMLVAATRLLEASAETAAETTAPTQFTLPWRRARIPAAAGSLAPLTPAPAKSLPQRTPSSAGSLAPRTPAPAGHLASHTPARAGRLPSRTPAPAGHLASHTPAPAGHLPSRTPTPAGHLAHKVPTRAPTQPRTPARSPVVLEPRVSTPAGTDNSRDGSPGSCSS